MYCQNCGKFLEDSTKFCGECGEKVTNESPKKQGESKNNVNKKEKESAVEQSKEKKDVLPEDLINSVKNAGGWVFATGLFGVILFPIIYTFSYINEYSEEGDILSLFILILISIAVYSAFIYLGNKIRKDDLTDLEKTLKMVSYTIVYTFIMFICLLCVGFMMGFIVIIMLIQLFKARKLIKENI